MAFWDHMDELRSRAILCAWVFFGGFLIAYFASDRVLSLLTRPLFAALPPERRHLYYTGLFENFFVHLRVAGYSALVALSPFFFLVIWGFIAPGLLPNEKRRILPFVAVGSLFFILGAAFAYFVLFPAGVKTFLSYGSETEVAWLTLSNYVSLVTNVLTGFGLAFQLPVVIVLMARLGLVTASSLAAHRKTAILVVAIVAALAAPPDAVSMLLLMLPLYLLFEGAVVAVRVIQKRAPNPDNTK